MKFDFTVIISTNNILTLLKEFDFVVFIMMVIKMKFNYWEEEEQNVSTKKKEV